jgi:hypothetical protein
LKFEFSPLCDALQNSLAKLFFEVRSACLQGGGPLKAVVKCGTHRSVVLRRWLLPGKAQMTDTRDYGCRSQGFHDTAHAILAMFKKQRVFHLKYAVSFSTLSKRCRSLPFPCRLPIQWRFSPAPVLPVVSVRINGCIFLESC